MKFLNLINPQIFLKSNLMDMKFNAFKKKGIKNVSFVSILLKNNKICYRLRSKYMQDFSYFGIFWMNSIFSLFINHNKQIKRTIHRIKGNYTLSKKDNNYIHMTSKKLFGYSIFCFNYLQNFCIASESLNQNYS